MLRSARSALLVLLAACVAAPLALSGCVSAEKEAKPDPKAPPVVLAPATIEHDKWATLGYRLDWNGFPFAASTRMPEIKRLVAFDDAVIAQERNSTVALMDASTGATRWSSQLGNDLTKFVGISRDSARNVLVSSESELFTIAPRRGRSNAASDSIAW